MEIQRDGRYWAIYDEAKTLVCLTVYKKGAAEVVRRLAAVQAPARDPAHTNTNDTAHSGEPTRAQTRPKKPTRRPQRRLRDAHAAPPVAEDIVAEDGGHARHLGTITLRVEVLFEGETHTP